MIHRVTAYLIAGYFLLSSVLLPLGDFSLIRDLPRMYHAYQQVAAPDEMGIADFIGDYLLDGKTLLGHNKEDAPANTAVKFQHADGLLSVPALHFHMRGVTVAEVVTKYIPAPIPAISPKFHNELFRPPLNTVA
ncbi:hypothetical protein HQ865_05655 [Mucilaginibacter mali]|uniref:Uncharacterized protein n=1 Tax=Mucilaginibacter mali TaxID=2740462 RepID=A0A7D4UCF3_9SPHI|nr:hypothetical protein [Mucilaginibacter mali]QKJ29259.1 hypothetical protein HQ865_05655 [Mucilaginibacter mali]